MVEPRAFSFNNAAVIRGIMVDGSYQALTMLLKDQGTSSVYHSLVTARSNATLVGTLELIRAIHDTLLKLEDSSTPLNTPQDALMLTTDLLDGLGRIYQVIDDSWFHQEALSEEEVFHRFVQRWTWDSLTHWDGGGPAVRRLTRSMYPTENVGCR